MIKKKKKYCGISRSLNYPECSSCILKNVCNTFIESTSHTSLIKEK